MDSQGRHAGPFAISTRQGARDYAQAMQWYRKAADQGKTEARTQIGFLYENGWGIPRDMAQARSWMQKAAAAGDPSAKDWLSRH